MSTCQAALLNAMNVTKEGLSMVAFSGEGINAIGLYDECQGTMYQLTVFFLQMNRFRFCPLLFT